MGKKSRMLNNAPLDSFEESVLEDSEINSCPTSDNSVKKSKKKNRKRDFSGTVTHDTTERVPSENVIESHISADPSTTKIKKKKTKKQPETTDKEAFEEDQCNDIDEIEPNAPKKKKNKHLLDQDDNDKQEIDQDNVQIKDNELQKSSKKKKNKDKLANKLDSKVESGEVSKKENGEVPKKKKKTRNKAKTGAPVLNDEEAQVTQEDIDKFCDELGEEDNKQYEDWVKLLDARLGKKEIKKE